MFEWQVIPQCAKKQKVNREVEATKLVVLEKQILVQLTSKFKPSKNQVLFTVISA